MLPTSAAHLAQIVTLGEPFQPQELLGGRGMEGDSLGSGRKLLPRLLCNRNLMFRWFSDLVISFRYP